MKKAVIYARVSSKEQEREGYSIPAQLQLMEEYALRYNIQIMAVFAEAETAKRAGRRKFNQMLTFLNAHSDVNVVLAEKTDRLYRNFLDVVKLDPDELDVEIHFVKENVILSKNSRASDKTHHGLKVVLAKGYCDNLSEEARKGMTYKASIGLWPSYAPIGYRNNLEDGTIEPDPKIAPLIRYGFELAASGQHTLRSLVKELNAKGLRSRNGNKVGKSAVKRIISNTLYYGPFAWSGITYSGVHSPIVSKNLFDRVQEAMGVVQKPKVTKRNFAFAGTLTCGHCGCAITAEIKKKPSGRTYTYYRCTNGKGICDHVIYIKEETIDHVIQKALEAIRMSPDAIEYTRAALSESHKAEREHHDAAVANLTTQYKRLQNRIDKCYEDKLEGTIEPVVWMTKTAEWKREQADIEARLSSHRKANTEYLKTGIQLMELAQNAATLFQKMTAEEKRKLANLVLSNPRVMNGNIEYDYKMPFAMFVGMTEISNWRG